MQSNSSQPKNGINHLRWCSFQLDWPYEVVSATANVISSRQQHPFEWAVVRILEQFADNLPSLQEAADELGIKDPVFLVDALQRLIESGMAEHVDPEKALDFGNCRLTNLAHARSDGDASSPERHGLMLCFDALTGEHLPAGAVSTNIEPQRPVLQPDRLPAPRTDIGLQRARELARAQDEPFLAGAAKITDVEVLADQNAYVWESIEASVAVDAEGVLQFALPGGTENQRLWIEGIDLKLPCLVQLMTESALGQEQSHDKPAVSYDRWRSSIERLIDPNSLGEEVTSLLDGADSHVTVNVQYLAIPQVSKALTLLQQRGIRCVIFGHRAQLKVLPEELRASVQTSELPDSSDSLNQVSVIVDGIRGLAIDKVWLRTPRDREITAFIAATLTSSQVQTISQTLPGHEAGTP
jgi:hypothetical protein